MVSKFSGYIYLGALCFIASNLHAAETYFVSVSASKEGDGSEKRPFQNLVSARDAIREARKSGKMAADSPVTVIIKPGIFRIEKSVSFGKQDGGVTYRAEKPGSVVLSGGTILEGEKFDSISDKEVFNRLDDSIRDKVLVYDLSPIISGPLPPFPNSFKGTPPGPWLYSNGRQMTLARWPNVDGESKGWTSFSKVIDNGLPNPQAEDSALRKLHPGAFVFDSDRPGKWDIESGAWLLGYWTHDWSDEVIKIDSYSPAEKVIRLAASHGYGLKGGTWGSSERRFFAQNILEELDSPGEWYIDRGSKKLYFYPLNPVSESNVVLATLTKPIVHIEGCEDLKLSGLKLEYTHGDCLKISKSRSIEVLGCQLSNIAGTAISANGNELTIRSCDLFNLGRGGISVSGGDRASLVRSENLIANNHIHHYGIFQRTYAAGISVSGCGTTVRNNLVHDAPHNAIKYGGNEHLFEKNEVHHVVMETGDSGAFYTGRDWTSQGNILRHNYIHHLGDYSSGSTHTMGIYLDDCDSGDTLEGNILYKVGRAFLIGGGRDNPIRNNLVIDCPVGIHLDSRGMSWKQWNNPKYGGWNLEEKARKLKYQSPPWSERYPNLAKIMSDSPQEPLYTSIETNVFIGSVKSPYNFDGNTKKILSKLKVDNNLVILKEELSEEAKARKASGFEFVKSPGDLGFADFETGDFTLKDDSFVLQKVPGFKRIPFGEIGLKVDDFRKTLPGK
ncbi:MAG: right-handed parallel beta-helix repeat-containing protein [Verrucomicrobiales bacterium]|nr:right-handed parallel beta-helix repeat-containing protein [Verrucomicrobiales bacterium]